VDGWTYFLQLARHHHNIWATLKWMIMTDRCIELENAVAAVFPHAQHIHCVVHLVHNIAASCGADALPTTKAVICEAAVAPNKGLLR